MCEIIEITKNNKALLDDFISSNILPNTFRYFNKRNSDVIQNHLITIILRAPEYNLSVGYAHIDFDDNKYWFGICVLDKYQEKCNGKKMMEYLFNNEKVKNISEIYLTVDKINIAAINLYTKFKFNIINETETYFIMLKS